MSRASRQQDHTSSQRDLFEARDTVENLKAAELEDYFRDECVESLRGRVTGLDRMAPGTAVLYPVLLPERTVLLVGTDDILSQFTVPVSRAEFTREVRVFRRLLEKRTTRQYRPHARQLYEWLVAPLQTLLDSRKIDTLVLVPDGPLRTIPLASLHDGERFLVERYAIASTPGLSLTDHRPLPAGETLVLANGITESVQGYPALGHVSMELELIEDLYGAKVLRDEAFRVEPVRKTLTETPYSIVHIASHGEFGAEVDSSFLLTYDGRLTMDQLERYMGLDLYRDRPVGEGGALLNEIVDRDARVVGVWKFGQPDGADRVDAPPALVGTERLGFSDVVTDSDGTVRRGLLYLDDGIEVFASVGLRLSLAWLRHEGVFPQPDPEHPGYLRLGGTTLPPLEPNDGG